MQKMKNLNWPQASVIISGILGTVLCVLIFPPSIIILAILWAVFILGSMEE